MKRKSVGQCVQRRELTVDTFEQNRGSPYSIIKSRQWSYLQQDLDVPPLAPAKALIHEELSVATRPAETDACPVIGALGLSSLRRRCS